MKAKTTRIGVRLPTTLYKLMKSSGYSITALILKLLREFFNLTEADCQ